jgi:hypothetical protein
VLEREKPVIEPVYCMLNPVLNSIEPIIECNDLPGMILCAPIPAARGGGCGSPARPGSRRPVMQLRFPEHETQPGPLFRHVPACPLEFLVLFTFGFFGNTLTTWDFFGRLIRLSAIIVCLHRQFTFETIQCSATIHTDGAAAPLFCLQ